jgi:hypothetical protein
MRILAYISLFFTLTASAVDKAPTMLRACLSNSDSTITISWSPVADACGSFVRYALYGNENSGPYVKIADIPNRLVGEHSYKLNNLNNSRNYYVVVHSLCDGIDSAQSTVLAVDISKPTQTQLKRVSYDTATQDIFAEWYPNPALDTKGYRIYEHTSGINDSIGETTDTIYTVSTQPAQVFDVSFATYDSCHLFSPISNPHRVSRLASSIDSCLQTITLSWTLYKGWSQIDSQQIYVSLNGAIFQHLASLTGSATGLQVNQIQLGDTLCFYLASYTNTTETIVSYSNTVCVETRALVSNSIYLANASLDPATMTMSSIDWKVDNDRDVLEYQVYSARGAAAYTLAATIPSHGNKNYHWDDLTADPTTASYHYYVEAIDICGAATSTSMEAQTIYLEKTQNSLSFNPYINWDGGVEEYEIEFLTDNGSTWNTLNTQASNTEVGITDEVYCYRVTARERMNSYGFAYGSHSNMVCVVPRMTLYAPETFSINGTNNRFIIVGQGIDHSKSRYQIYNRWGQMVASLPTDQAWYGDFRGDNVTTGLYPFVITAVGLKGEKEQINGVLRIIE